MDRMNVERMTKSLQAALDGSGANSRQITSVDLAMVMFCEGVETVTGPLSEELSQRIMSVALHRLAEYVDTCELDGQRLGAPLSDNVLTDEDYAKAGIPIPPEMDGIYNITYLRKE